MVADKPIEEQGVDDKLKAPRLVLLLLALCACDGRKAEATPPPAASTGPVNPDAGVTAYRCQDGQTIVAGYPDSKSAVVTYKDHAYSLKLAGTDGGVRYTGYGLQWTVQGGRGVLAVLKPGEERASDPGLACAADEAGKPAATETAFTPARP
ncbi:MliC family protein [Phenylobacterium sp.]|uniref:MliC family protein n=1 Tax=Phenylobacterium sp. TaxID=1871053 RepID=UPI003565F7ED